jgi:hypothetical protein
MKTVQHKFVDLIPDKLEEGVLYICIPYCTAIHKCVCGCSNEVVTPISPTGWTLSFYGDSVSLSPSIGNWSFKCRSHYFITKNKIRHVYSWDDWKIILNRKQEEKEKQKFDKKRRKQRKQNVGGDALDS